MQNRFNLCALPCPVRGQPFPLNKSPDNTKLLYTSGHSVVIRELDSPQYADIYTQVSGARKIKGLLMQILEGKKGYSGHIGM